MSLMMEKYTPSPIGHSSFNLATNLDQKYWRDKNSKKTRV